MTNFELMMEKSTKDWDKSIDCLISLRRGGRNKKWSKIEFWGCTKNK